MLLAFYIRYCWYPATAKSAWFLIDLTLYLYHWDDSEYLKSREQWAARFNDLFSEISYYCWSRFPYYLGIIRQMARIVNRDDRALDMDKVVNGQYFVLVYVDGEAHSLPRIDIAKAITDQAREKLQNTSDEEERAKQEQIILDFDPEQNAKVKLAHMGDANKYWSDFTAGKFQKALKSSGSKGKVKQVGKRGDAGSDIDLKVQREVMDNAVAEVIIVDWNGIEIDGSPDCTLDARKKWVNKFEPEWKAIITETAGEVSNYREMTPDLMQTSMDDIVKNL